MEKVIVIKQCYSLDSYDVKEINEYLHSGWTVKHVKMNSCSDWITAIFVLEKN